MDPGGDFPSTGYINPKLELRVRTPHMHILPVKIFTVTILLAANQNVILASHAYVKLGREEGLSPT